VHWWACLPAKPQSQGPAHAFPWAAGQGKHMSVLVCWQTSVPPVWRVWAGIFLAGHAETCLLWLVSQLRITLPFSAAGEPNNTNNLSPKCIAYWAIFCTWAVHHPEIILSAVWYSSNHSTPLTSFLFEMEHFFLKDTIGCIDFLSDK